MTAVVRTELYRLATVRSWWLSVVGACALTTLVAFGESGPWAGLVGMVTFLFGVVGAAQHYQHRTAFLVFLARPRRLAVLAGQTVAYAAAALLFAAATGLPVLAQGRVDDYACTVLGAPLLAVFAVANAAILRRPIWIIIGWGLWFVIVDALIGRLEIPLPFSSYLNGSVRDHTMGIALIGWAAVSLGAAGWFIRRDVTGD